MAEQRYEAVRAVIADDETVTEVAARRVRLGRRHPRQGPDRDRRPLRYLLACSAHAPVTGTVVADTFLQAGNTHGLARIPGPRRESPDRPGRPCQPTGARAPHGDHPAAVRGGAPTGYAAACGERPGNGKSRQREWTMVPRRECYIGERCCPALLQVEAATCAMAPTTTRDRGRVPD